MGMRFLLIPLMLMVAIVVALALMSTPPHSEMMPAADRAVGR